MLEVNLKISVSRLFLSTLGVVSGVLSGFLLCGLSVCYGLRADSVAAITVFPHWVWIVPAAFLLWVGFRDRKSLHVLTLMGWFVFIVVFSDNPIRFFHRTVPEREHANLGEQKKFLRVVSLNCAGGSEDAAREVIRLRPDIVFFQEVPKDKSILKLTKDLFGEKGNYVSGEEAAILAPGDVTPIPGAPWYAIRAKIKMANGIELDATTFRLKAPIVRADLWSPGCWRVQKEDRILRRKQLKQVMDFIESRPSNIPSIMGGDFNAPPGDAIFRQIGLNWGDAFEKGGTGWGATMPNEYPLFRIDRIFMSSGIPVVQARTERTKSSDHRALIVDMIIQ